MRNRQKNSTNADYHSERMSKSGYNNIGDKIKYSDQKQSPIKERMNSSKLFQKLENKYIKPIFKKNGREQILKLEYEGASGKQSENMISDSKIQENNIGL